VLALNGQIENVLSRRLVDEAFYVRRTWLCSSNCASNI
jgi:hypothetical protein